jgi:hypothetical protein
MAQLSEEQMEELKLRFGAIIEYEKKKLAYQEEIKETNSSVNETIKGIAETLEVKPSAVKKAVKEYMESKKEKDIYAEKESILTMLMEYNFIK